MLSDFERAPPESSEATHRVAPGPPTLRCLHVKAFGCRRLPGPGAAAVIGGLVWEAIFPTNDGIAWIGSIIVGIVLVWLYATMVGRGRTTRVG